MRKTTFIKRKNKDLLNIKVKFENEVMFHNIIKIDLAEIVAVGWY